MAGDAAAEALGMMAAVRDDPARRLIDYGVMLPRIQALYAFAAADLDEPRLRGFVQDGLPAYAWTNDEDHPWTTSRSPRLRSILRWLTSS
jgi:hypothetical protein